MAEQLGKIEKPHRENYSSGRKLYFVPLIFAPLQPLPELKELIDRYWREVEIHLANLETKLGRVNKVYHELVPAEGEKGVKAIEDLNSNSYRIIKVRTDNGAILQAIEDVDMLTEYMDWGKCLAAGLQNNAVFDKVYEHYKESQKKRNSHLSRQINETLKENEVGILLMSESHQVQFPPDIQVFYVSPPALDEIKRWIRARQTETGDTEARDRE
jgi:hypothetical protein